MKACFTGHRWLLNTQSNVYGINKLIDYALDNGVTEFYNGMAIGTDLLAANILIERNLPFTAIIPCQDQSEKWPIKLKNKYEHIKSKAIKIIVLADTYTPNCMAIRNKFMVDNSDILLSVYDGKKTVGSGTYLTINMAIKKNLTVFNYNPDSKTFTFYNHQQLSLF